MSGECDSCGEHTLDCICRDSKLKRFRESSVIGCLNDTGITSQNYKSMSAMEWISVEESLPDDEFKKYLVKKANGEIITAHFMPDKIAWIAWYGLKTSYWMRVDSGKLIYDVTHWRNKSDGN